MNKKGQVRPLKIDKFLFPIAVTVIGIIVLINIFAGLVPEAQTAGNELNATGVPLGSLFTENSIVVVLIMIGLFLTILAIVTRPVSPQL